VKKHVYHLQRQHVGHEAGGYRNQDVVHTVPNRVKLCQQHIRVSTASTEEHINSAAEKSKTTTGNSGPIGNTRDGIQQEPYTYCHSPGTNRGGYQYDRAICADLVSEQVGLCKSGRSDKTNQTLDEQK
jgi:hypothetical protein